MASIIRQENIFRDEWQVLELKEYETPERVRLPIGPLLVPLAVWQARRQALIEREWEHGWPLGVWLAAGEGPEAIAGDLDDLSVVAVHFPKVTDGRGYSAAHLLRERYGYRGEVRAIGQVTRDQLHYLRRSGFDAFALRADQDVEASLGSLHDFDESYQAAIDQPLPLFRRRPTATDFARTA
jgi:uncharacterized protein (DUF934 family)